MTVLLKVQPREIELNGATASLFSEGLWGWRRRQRIGKALPSIACGA